jgi:dolichyl-phosphate-mannose--protein O-mannosyl transferase
MTTIAPLVSSSNRQSSSFLTQGMALVWLIALAKLLFHIYFNNRYGYFRDEFNYIACGDHLGWGYVDQPPLIPFLIHISRAVLGDSLRAIRFIPALASSLLVVQTALIVRVLGGRRYALLLSAITAAIAPQYLSNGSLLGTNCLEPNLWMGCAYFVVLAIKRNRFALLALVWRRRRNRTGREVLDRAIRIRSCCWPAPDRAAPRLSQ